MKGVQVETGTDEHLECEMQIFENFIAPIVVGTVNDGRLKFEALHGTAFFVNDERAFITASHVIKQAKAHADAKGGFVGIAMRNPNDPTHTYHGTITAGEFAPEPYDVAVGVVDRPTYSYFKLGEGVKTWMWHEVHTVG